MEDELQQGEVSELCYSNLFWHGVLQPWAGSKRKKKKPCGFLWKWRVSLDQERQHLYEMVSIRYEMVRNSKIINCQMHGLFIHCGIRVGGSEHGCRKIIIIKKEKIQPSVVYGFWGKIFISELRRLSPQVQFLSPSAKSWKLRRKTSAHKLISLSLQFLPLGEWCIFNFFVELHLKRTPQY